MDLHAYETMVWAWDIVHDSYGNGQKFRCLTVKDEATGLCLDILTAIHIRNDDIRALLNDSAYGMIKWKQEGVGFKNYGLDFNNPDLVQYADSFGATGHNPQSHEEFLTALDAALNGSGVHLIDLPVDYLLNHSILNVLLKESACIV